MYPLNSQCPSYGPRFTTVSLHAHLPIGVISYSYYKAEKSNIASRRSPHLVIFRQRTSVGQDVSPFFYPETESRTRSPDELASWA
jgi:hypothetical protein